MAGLFDGIDYQDQFGQQAPFTPSDKTPFQNAQQLYQTSSQLAQNSVSPESRDRAAARLRSSVDNMARQQEGQIADWGARRGISNSGMTDQRRMSNFAQAQGAYAQGLGQLEDNWARQNIDAANSISNAASGMSNNGMAAGQLGLNEYSDTQRLGIERVNANTGLMRARTDLASTRADAAQRALTTFLTQGNVLNVPSDAADLYRMFGVDINGLEFFRNPGTPTSGGVITNPDGTVTTLPPSSGGGLGTGGSVGSGSTGGGAVDGGSAGGGALIPTITDASQFASFPQFAQYRPTFEALENALRSSGLSNGVRLSTTNPSSPQIGFQDISRGMSTPASEALRRAGADSFVGRNISEIRATVSNGIAALTRELNKTRGGGSSLPFYDAAEKAAISADIQKLRALSTSLRNVNF